MFGRRFFGLSLSLVLLGFVTGVSAQDDAKNAFALEIYQQALADNSCEMYGIVIDDYPNTSAAKLAKIKLRTCTNSSSLNDDPPIDEATQEELDQYREIGEEGADCRGYWTGSFCMTNKRDLIRELQSAYLSLGCPVGRPDGVWGKRTSMGVIISNKYYGENFRRSSPISEYGRLIRDLYSLNYRMCDCEPGRVLRTDGLCYKINNNASSNSNSGRNYDQSGATCGWFAISSCSRSSRDAENASNRYGGYVIYTERSSYPNFTSGYYCAVEGPYNKSSANRAKNQARSRGASTAYIKNSCR